MHHVHKLVGRPAPMPGGFEMKNMKTCLASTCVALVACMSSEPAWSQIEGNLSVYSENNAKGYLEPLKKAMGAGIASGMYMSAHLPETFSFRVSATGMLVNFGDDDKTFSATTEDYFPVRTTVDNAPTVVGPEAGVTVTDEPSGAQFTFPGGLNMSRLGLAVPQVTAGFMGTEAMVRWIAFETGDTEIGEISVWGIGGRHSISRYFDEFPVDLAGMVFYQSFDVGDDLLDSSLFTLGAQASKRFPGIPIEPYGGLALDFYNMKAKYDQTVQGETRPVTLDYGTDTNLHLTLGAALHFAFVHLNGEINIADQFSFAFGLALGI